MSRLISIGRQLSSRSEQRVEVLLRGGLGNQLFGWAAGMNLANRIGFPLHLVTREYQSGANQIRKFELDQLLNSRVTSGPDVNSRKSFREKGFSYDVAIEAISKPIVLDGYFQSARYFSQSKNDILAALRKTEDFRRGSAAHRQDFIGVQIRRGDYLNPIQSSFHGVVPEEHFLRVIPLLRALVGPLPVRVFSDDLEVATAFSGNLPGTYAHSPGPTESSLETLGCLSSAKALAISNSSFGWWAAYLSGKKVPVITPRPWFRNRQIDTSDLLIKSWLTLGF